MPWTDVETLLKTAFDIVDRYSHLFFATVTSRNVIGHDDYLGLLSVLQTDWEAWDKKLAEQVRAAAGVSQSR